MKKKIENAKQLGKKRLKHPPIWHSSAEVPETNEMVLTVLKKGDGIIDRFLNADILRNIACLSGSIKILKLTQRILRDGFTLKIL